MLVGTPQGRVSAWQMKDGWPTDERRLADHHASYVNDIEFSEDGLTMVTGSDDNDVRIWNSRTLFTGSSVLRSQIRTRLSGHHAASKRLSALNASVSMDSDGRLRYSRVSFPVF